MSLILIIIIVLLLFGGGAYYGRGAGWGGPPTGRRTPSHASARQPTTWNVELIRDLPYGDARGPRGAWRRRCSSQFRDGVAAGRSGWNATPGLTRGIRRMSPIPQADHRHTTTTSPRVIPAENHPKVARIGQIDPQNLPNSHRSRRRVSLFTYRNIWVCFTRWLLTDGGQALILE